MREAGHLSGRLTGILPICPSDVLPALIAEYSMEEFIEPGLTEEVVRRILMNRWQLKKYKGYDKGVRLGLALLGMEAEIRHWYQENPPGPANTQNLTIIPTGSLVPSSPYQKGPVELHAATRMVRATKRFSQDIAVRFGFSLNATSHLGAGGFGHLHDIRTPRTEARAQAIRHPRAALIGHIHSIATIRALQIRQSPMVAIFGKLEAI